jgi:hypothetical protein
MSKFQCFLCMFTLWIRFAFRHEHHMLFAFPGRVLQNLMRLRGWSVRKL